jgi:hypothetical protein
MRFRRGIFTRGSSAPAAILALGAAVLWSGSAFAVCSIDGPSAVRAGETFTLCGPRARDLTYEWHGPGLAGTVTTACVTVEGRAAGTYAYELITRDGGYDPERCVHVVRVGRGTSANEIPVALAARESGARPIATFIAAAPAPRNLAPADNKASGASSLSATTEKPWVPSKPVPRREPWEQVLLFPGRVVSLPLVGLGYATERGLAYAENSGKIPLNLFVAGPSSQTPHYGLSFKTPGLPDHSGLGAAVELREPIPVVSGRLKTQILGRYAASIRRYNRTQIDLVGRPGLLEYGYDWRPEERFYGIGPGSSRDSLSDYAVQSEWVRLGMDYGWNRDTDLSPARTRISGWFGTRDDVVRTGRDAHAESFDERFPSLANRLDRRVEHLIYGASFSSNWRTGVPHWGHGWRILLSAERHDAPLHALALRVGTPLGAQFTRYEIQTETGYSWMRDPRTLRVMARVVHQDINSGRSRLLLSDLSTLGGREGLGGFEPGRFRDVDLLLTRLQWVFPIARRIETELHSDWGNVYPNVWEDAAFHSLRNSVGFSFRGRYARGVLMSVGMDFSREVWRVRYSIGGVE